MQNGFRFLFLLLTGCGTMTTPKDSNNDGTDTGDTQITCDAICTGKLEIRFLDGRNDFLANLTGEGFNPLNLACPDGVAAGGVGTATCVEGGFDVEVEGYAFPEEMSLTLDRGMPQTLTPSYEESIVCGTVCNSALVDVSVE